MKIDVSLSCSHGRLSNREPFLLVKNDALELRFTAKQPLTDFIITARNGDVTGTYRAKDAAFTVPAQFCFAGHLDVVVSLVERGETVKSWAVEPVILKELSVGFEGHPEFDDIKASMERIAAEMESIRTLSTNWSELSARVNSLQELVEGNAGALQDTLKLLTKYNPIP